MREINNKMTFYLSKITLNNQAFKLILKKSNITILLYCILKNNQALINNKIIYTFSLNYFKFYLK
jgi:hypothetical protein